MSKKEATVIINGVKITPQLTVTLNNIIESDLNRQKNLLATNCLLISGLNNPDILPIDQEFFLAIHLMYELICSLEGKPDPELEE